MVKVTELTKRYGKNTVVDHISFELREGQIYGLLGPNGAGKSTTIKMLTGCLFPTAGSITIAGHDLLRAPEEAKRCIGYLPEIPPLYPAMTPREYLMFMAEIKGLAKQDRAAQVEEVMEKTHITSMRDRLIRHLSKGYTQRVGIAQALLGSPRLLVLDEPVVGLDPTQIVEIRNLIQDLGKSHTVIFSSHILGEVSMLCDQLLVISDGKLIANDKAENLRSLVQEQDILSVTVTCQSEQAKAALTGIPQVERIECSDTKEGYCSVLLYQASGSDIQDEVFSRIHQAGFKVVQMGVRRASLEDVFLSLLEKSKQGTNGLSRDKGA